MGLVSVWRRVFGAILGNADLWSRNHGSVYILLHQRLEHIVRSVVGLQYDKVTNDRFSLMHAASGMRASARHSDEL